MTTSVQTAGHCAANLAAHPASDVLGHVRRPPHLRLCHLLSALVSPRFPPLLPLLPILLPLTSTLGSCILILLRLPITPDALASERGPSRSSGDGAGDRLGDGGQRLRPALITAWGL